MSHRSKVIAELAAELQPYQEVDVVDQGEIGAWIQLAMALTETVKLWHWMTINIGSPWVGRRKINGSGGTGGPYLMIDNPF